MKALLSIIFLFAVMSVNATTYYVATPANGGSDSNPGTFASPWATWDKCSNLIVAGDSVIIRGGTYRGRAAGVDVQVRWSNLHGSVGDSIVIINYPGETPIMNVDNVTYTNGDVYVGYLEYSEYTKIKGLTFKGLAQNVSVNVVYGLVLSNADHNVIELCKVEYIGGTAVLLLDSDDNLFLNSDVSHCGDNYSGYTGANGFSITGGSNTSARNTFDGCRAWDISDDGFDFYLCPNLVTIKNCWSFHNGFQPGTNTHGGDGVGFKSGPNREDNTTTTIRVLTGNMAFNNYYIGFDENNNPSNRYRSYLANNTSYSNGTNSAPYGNGYNYAYYSTSVSNFVNNLSYVTANDLINTESTKTTNSWQGGITVSSADFTVTTGLDSTGVAGTRNVDGSKPNLPFLKLAAGDLVDAGTNVGLPFNGTAPDIGAYELGEDDGNANPTANAGVDFSVPPTTCTLNGSASFDIDGTISTYAWVKLSGTGGTIVTASSATTSVTGLTAGTYIFQLTVTDNDGATSVDTVTVTVIESATRLIIIK